MSHNLTSGTHTLEAAQTSSPPAQYIVEYRVASARVVRGPGEPRHASASTTLHLADQTRSSLLLPPYIHMYFLHPEV